MQTSLSNLGTLFAQGLLHSFSLEECLLAARLDSSPLVEQIRSDPTTIMRRAGLNPDPWQSRYLASRSKREMLLCSRQSGKSTASAAKALAVALTEPNSDVLLFSPTLRQSMELFRKIVWFWRTIGKPVRSAALTKTQLELANGSRIISLPDCSEGVVGYSARLIVIDEGARVSDELYYSVRPMLAATNGDLLAISTPFGKRGWFFDEWERAEEADYKGLTPGFRQTLITAEHCPRIVAAQLEDGRSFLEEERRALGEVWYGQEYLCLFRDAVGAVFAKSVIDAALTDEVPPLFGSTS